MSISLLLTECINVGKFCKVSKHTPVKEPSSDHTQKLGNPGFRVLLFKFGQQSHYYYYRISNITERED